jgi:Type II restriction endonuclease EcoO109I
MNNVVEKELKLEQLIDSLLDTFYSRRIKKLNTLKLKETLTRKNPYLYKATGVEKASEIVQEILTAYMSSSDEGIFGDAFFEPLAEAVAVNGRVSETVGIDVISEEEIRYKAIAVKSGPSVFNSTSRTKQIEYFKELRSRVQKRDKIFDAVVGYGYGKKQSDNGDFREIAGQAFWEELTGDSEFYLKIIDLMGQKPQKHLPEYLKAFDAAVNRFTGEFINDFCKPDGTINWEKIVRFNSGKPCKKLTIVPKNKSLKEGETLQLSIIATFYGEETIEYTGSEEVEYKNLCEDVIEITKSGIVTIKKGAKPGDDAKIIITCASRTGTVKIKVKK